MATDNDHKEALRDCIKGNLATVIEILKSCSEKADAITNGDQLVLFHESVFEFLNAARNMEQGTILAIEREKYTDWQGAFNALTMGQG